MLGSRAFCGDCDLEDWERRGVADAMAAAGFDFGRLGEAARVDELGAYLELHIEQGPVLERNGVDLGVVTAVTGMLGFRVRFTGEANHAGTTPMELRRDALAGAARVVLALREVARGRDDMTANVGVISGGAGRVQRRPRRGRADDRRPVADRRRIRVAGAVRPQDARSASPPRSSSASSCARRTGSGRWRSIPTCRTRSRRRPRRRGRRRSGMPSGAGHDAMVLAHHVPAAMLFVPSRGGLSHTPDEFTAPEQCELGARVLARAVRQLVE